MSLPAVIMLPVSSIFAAPANRLAVLIVALACVACVPGGTLVESTPRMASASGRLAAGTVKLDGEPMDCLFLLDASGGRVPLEVPVGWETSYRPLRIQNPSGLVTAQEGDLVRVTYSADGIGGSVCGPGRPIFAESLAVID